MSGADPSADPASAPPTATFEAEESLPTTKGKSSTSCCQHPEKKKKNPYAEGFSKAIKSDEKPAKTDDGSDEEEEEKKDDKEEMISEENLISELEIDPTEEDINLVQLRIFDHSKVALHTLTNCKILQLRQNLIHEVHAFPDNLHDDLRELDIYDNKIKAIPEDHFNVFKRLKTLDLSYNNIRIIENIDLPTLEVLFLTENKITKMQNLGNVPNLKQLELGSNRIRKIEGLEKVPLLEDLWLGKNKIQVLEGLDGLVHLKRLSLQANRLGSVGDGLKNNTSLTDLHLSENGIKVMEGVKHLQKIRLIDFCFNPITEIHEVDELPVIEELWCTDARIANWREVEKLEKMKTLQTIYLERNPVEDARYRHKLAMLLPNIKEIDSWPVARRDITGNLSDGMDPRGKWVDTEKAEITFKASRGDAPIMPTAAEVEQEKKDAAAQLEDKPAEGGAAAAADVAETPVQERPTEAAKEEAKKVVKDVKKEGEEVKAAEAPEAKHADPREDVD